MVRVNALGVGFSMGRFVKALADIISQCKVEHTRELGQPPSPKPSLQRALVGRGPIATHKHHAAHRTPRVWCAGALMLVTSRS